MSEPQKEDRSYRWCWDEGDIIFVDDEFILRRIRPNLVTK